ncbi:MAG: type I restriction endonuclease [Burkholderiaceae bacterium]
MAANRELWRLLREGVAVELRQPDGSLKPDRVRVIDWVDPGANDFFVASQTWVASELYKRRPDALGFVNGLPLLLCEVEGA